MLPLPSSSHGGLAQLATRPYRTVTFGRGALYNSNELECLYIIQFEVSAELCGNI